MSTGSGEWGMAIMNEDEAVKALALLKAFLGDLDHALGEAARAHQQTVTGLTQVSVFLSQIETGWTPDAAQVRTARQDLTAAVGQLEQFRGKTSALREGIRIIRGMLA
jgi:hypothetical protein